MPRCTRATVVVVGLGLLLTPPTRGAAQEPDTLGAPIGYATLDGVYARPVGEFHQHVKRGVGVDLAVVWPPRFGGPLALRGDVGFIVYGSETREVCFSSTVGCRVQLDLTTTNSVAFFHVGPQVMVPAGPVRPYAHAGIGLSVFSTASEVVGTDDSEPFASSTNHSDFTFSWTGGAGLLVPLSRAMDPPMLDLGVRYIGNGEVEYLKGGDIHDNPDGPPTITPTRSEANLLSVRIGITIPIRLGVPAELEP